MIRALALLLALLNLVGIVAAQLPPPQNKETFDDRNMRVEYGMAWYTPPTFGGPADCPYEQLVSGTRNEIAFYVDVSVSDQTFANPWTHCRVDQFKVTGGAAPPLLIDEAYDEGYGVPQNRGGAQSLGGGPITPTPSYYRRIYSLKRVRIASTEFADGSPIEFIITAKLHFWSDADPTGVIVTKTIAARLKACNRVILLATNEEFCSIYNDAKPPVKIGEAYLLDPGPDTIPNQPLYKKAASDAMPLVRPYWAIVNHTIFPDVGKETRWGENTVDGTLRVQKLQAEMNKYTAFFAFTHGENTNPVHFRASVGPDTVSDGQVYGTEVGPYAYTGRTIPDYQVAIFYSCSLGGSTSLPNGFKVNPVTYPVWRGIAGFNYQCWYKLSDYTTTLDKHAKKLMEYLSQGIPLQVALDKVQGSGVGNDHMTPLNGAGGPMDMNANGSYARLRYVYLEPSIFDPRYFSTNPALQASVNTWFWFL